MKKNIIVIGAGISGLSTAYWLQKNDFKVTVLESASKPGGAMQTGYEAGFLIDYGPNSGLETTPLISQIAEEVGIKDKMVYANESSNKRYILKNDKLHALPMSPPSFLKTNLFSTKAKLRIMKEPFVPKSDDGYYQSIAEFVERRLGREFLDYAIDPFVSGVFAGDPNKLSVKSAFPKLYRLEEVYGGLIKGMIRGAKERKARNEESKQSAKMFSFIDGMQTFPSAIASKLNNIKYNSPVEKITKNKNGYIINTADGDELITDIVLTTIPAYVLSSLITEIDSQMAEHLNSVYYPPVSVLYAGFKKSQIGLPLDGFGYLIPSKERKNFLGAIWSSTIFPNRAENDHASFTIFIGGARTPGIFNTETDSLVESVMSEFKNIMEIDGDPVILKHKHWGKAIPQYNLGYIEHERYFEKFEKNYPGFFVSGNFRGGISVGDCIKNSEIVFNKIKNFVS
ncbi:MAG: protoporphyrinogen oxidase [Melioribacteraceae bacterium]|nr:protoporphyrinogen oxidase [Melioribacteraceae bacterium]